MHHCPPKRALYGHFQEVYGETSLDDMLLRLWILNPLASSRVLSFELATAKMNT